MFIKISKMEAIFKKAYKGAGISIERNGDRLIVATTQLYIETDIVGTSKDFMAAVVRYVGKIPTDGESFTIREHEEQVNIAGTHDLKLIETDTLQGKEFFGTPFVYYGDQVLQSSEDGQLITIPMAYW